LNTNGFCRRERDEKKFEREKESAAMTHLHDGERSDDRKSTVQAHLLLPVRLCCISKVQNSSEINTKQ
jgi:hypothetical protein